MTGSTMHTSIAWMSEFPEENISMIDRVIHSIGSERTLPGDVNTVMRIYRIPEGAEQGDTLHPKAWIQTAGSTDRLTVEVKRQEADQVYRQYVVGRKADAPEATTSEVIRFANTELPVLPSEVLTADEATELFLYYYDHDSIPDGWSLRELPKFADTSAAQASR